MEYNLRTQSGYIRCTGIWYFRSIKRMVFAGLPGNTHIQVCSHILYYTENKPVHVKIFINEI